LAATSNYNIYYISIVVN